MLTFAGFRSELMGALAPLAAATILASSSFQGLVAIGEVLSSELPTPTVTVHPLQEIGNEAVTVSSASLNTNLADVLRRLYSSSTESVVSSQDEPGRTLLNQVGRLANPVDQSEIDQWTSTIAKAPFSREALWCQLWLAEYKIGSREPDSAMTLLKKVIDRAPKDSDVYGLARYDHAIAQFYAGMYSDSSLAFAKVINEGLIGIDVQLAALFQRKARACAAIHERNKSLGIEQPDRLDPLCGVSSVAVIMRSLGRPYGEEYLKTVVPFTGEGSSAQDLFVAAERLGLNAYAVSATEKGMRDLPTPAIAFVEHDHFVVMLETNDSGVTYHCSDCGEWPGGSQKVTWSQWRAMEPSGFVLLLEPGTDQDAAMAALCTAKQRNPNAMSLAEVESEIGSIQHLSNAARALVSSLVAQITSPRIPLMECGAKPSSLKCAPKKDCPPAGLLGGGWQECATANLEVTPHSSTAGDPVNLATGEEEYQPAPDLVVYNPNGPDVYLSRFYNTFNRVQTGFGYSWSHPYHVGVVMAKASSEGGIPRNNGFIVFPTDARIAFYSTIEPTPLNPLVRCNVEPGYPVEVYWELLPNSTNKRFIVRWQDRSEWITESFRHPEMDFQMISKYRDRFGNELNFEYQDIQTQIRANPAVYIGQRRLVSIKDTAGLNLLSFALDINANYQSATDRYGRTVNYLVEAEENATKVYHDWYWELQAVSQVNSANIRYEYDYSNEFAGHNNVKFLKKIRVPSPTGTGMSESVFEYGLPGQEIVGYVKSVTDSNGNKTTFDYTNAWETTVRKLNPANQVQLQYTVGFNGQLLPTHYKDANGDLVAELVYGGATTNYRPTSVTLHYDANTTRTWSMTYDVYGNLLSSTTPKGTITTIDYEYPTSDLLGRPVEIQEGTKTSTELTYHPTTGLLHTVSSPIPGESGTGNRLATTYTYTAKGNIASIQSPGNNATTYHTTTFNYTTDGNYSQTEKFGQPLTISNTAGEKTHYRYDARGNVEKSWDQLGDEQVRCFTATYNIVDDVLSTEAPATSSSGNGRSRTTTEYLYLGGPVTSVKSYAENNALFRTINYAYGPEGELLSVSGNTESASVTYDAAYRTKTFSDGKNQTTNYIYDVVGRMTSVRLPLYNSGTGYDSVNFTSFNRLGQPLTRVDGRGISTQYIYGDTDGQLTAVDYPGSADDIAISYDSYGRATSVLDGTGTASYIYDDLDGVTSASRTYTGISAKTFNYTYHPDGSRDTMSTPAGTWNYVYDSTGRPLSVVSPSGSLSYGYFGNGWLASRNHDLASTYYDYNQLGLLKDQQALITVPGEVQELLYNNFAYDGVFNLTGVQQHVFNHTPFTGTNTWTYDSKNRLTQDASTKTGGFTHNFAYDNAGNPTTFKGASQSFNANNQKSATGFTFDGNGNPTTYGGVTCTYDAENRMTAYGSVLTNGYRADGLRAWKQVGSTRTYFLYDGGNPIIEMDSSGNVTAINDFGPDGLKARKVGSNWTYYTFDQQGNVALRQNASGTIVSRSTFDAYGAETSTGSPSDPYAYNGQWGYYLDRETGLYLCQNRFYDPTQGRWINRDPIGYAGGQNLYGYTGGAPVNWADPSGLWRAVVGGVLGGVAGFILGGPAGSFAGATLGAGLGGAADEAQRQIDAGENIDWGRIGAEGGKEALLSSVCDIATMGLGKVFRGARMAAGASGPEVFTHAAGEARSTYRGKFLRQMANDPDLDKKYGPGSRELAKSGKNPTFTYSDGLEYPGEFAHRDVPYRDGGTVVEFIPPWEHAARDPQRHWRPKANP